MASASQDSPVKKALRTVVAVLLLLLAVILAIGSWGYHDFVSRGPLPSPTLVMVPRGSGLQEIAALLAERRVIHHPSVFETGVVLSGEAARLKAGEYEFPPRISPRQVMEMLAEGKTLIRRFTLAEGLTSQEAVQLLLAEQGLEGDIGQTPPEGVLLPETYHFSLGDRRSDVLGRMRRAMTEILASLWEKRAEGLPFNTPKEALTLASIVEKETGVPSERGRVAAVFINRLRKGMKLQSDPTVIYGLTSGAGPLDRALTLNDLEGSTDYNTYVIGGLPPGPIANPGRASLMAVLNPPQSDELYFVADGHGGHRFAATLAEHNENVRKYREMMKKMNDE